MLSELATQITQLEDYRTHNLQDDLARAQQRGSNPKFATRVMDSYRQYKNVNVELSKIIHDSTPPDLGSRLSEIGANQQKIETLKKEIAQAKTDLQTAQERDQQISADPPKISEYEGISKYFGLVKPLHTISVSILFGSALFILIVCGLLIKDNILMFSFLHGAQQTQTQSPLHFLKDPRVWATLFGASLIVILFLSLKIANKLPILP